jgi:hypothetical protein
MAAMRAWLVPEAHMSKQQKERHDGVQTTATIPHFFF